MKFDILNLSSGRKEHDEPERIVLASDDNTVIEVLEMVDEEHPEYIEFEETYITGDVIVPAGVFCPRRLHKIFWFDTETEYEYDEDDPGSGATSEWNPITKWKNGTPEGWTEQHDRMVKAARWILQSLRRAYHSDAFEPEQLKGNENEV